MSSRILIVEDEANVRLNYRITLETEGYEVVEAATAASALLLLVERSFAVAILDMRLPRMDGLELLAKMRPFRRANHGDFLFPSPNKPRQPITVQDLAIWQARQTVFEKIGAYSFSPMNLSNEEGRPERFSGGMLSVAG